MNITVPSLIIIVKRLPLLLPVLLMVNLVYGQPSIEVKAPPSNDNFANAQLITSFPFSSTINTINEATIQPGEAQHPCRVGGASAGSHSVWYRFVTTIEGQFSADSTDSGFLDVNDEDDEDSVMTLYTQTLTPVVCNDESQATPDSYAIIPPTVIQPGTYYLQVSAAEACNTANCYLEAPSSLVVNINFTVIPTPTPTLDPNFTPSPTSTIDPDVTPTQTSPPQPTFTPTATDLIPFAELLRNRSFEADNDNNGAVDNWNASGAGKATGRDKRKCNRDDKVIAYEGLCVYQFKSAVDEKSKLVQDIDLTLALPALINGGDTLRLSGYVNARGTINAKVKVRVTYTDDTLNRGKITLKLDAPTGDFTALEGTTSLQLAADPQLIRVTLQNKGTSGKVLFDLMSLELVNTVAP